MKLIDTYELLDSGPPVNLDDPDLPEIPIPETKDLEHPEMLVIGRDIPAYWL
jgi:hypothetical protein